MAIRGIDHVQLAMPAGGEDVARDFYTGLLGIPETPKPPNLAKNGGCWFEDGPVKLHIGRDPDFHPATRAHPALVVTQVRSLAAKLEAAGVAIHEDPPIEGMDRFYVFDPFGNRVEFLEYLDS